MTGRFGQKVARYFFLGEVAVPEEPAQASRKDPPRAMAKLSSLPLPNVVSSESESEQHDLVGNRVATVMGYC